jgi:ABC-type dipeptide/oligopeptide/nickel transport system permease subunit
LIHGSRITLFVVILVAVLAAPIGLLVGTVAGYAGGWVDASADAYHRHFSGISAADSGAGFCGRAWPRH